MKNTLIISFLIFTSIIGYTQDIRTTETKVADLLARMPVNNTDDLKKQMQEMSILEPRGRRQITEMVVPPGTGDDTRARFAIESYSRYLSEYGHENEKYQWESECIDAVLASGYPMVRSFFLSQLRYIGSEKSVEFASGFLTDEDMCESAVSVISSCDSHEKEDILAMSLQIKTLPCVESIINTLAMMKSDKAIKEYPYWYLAGDKDLKAAALNAMAESAHANVYKMLASAADDVSYNWDPTGATASLVQYARNIGDKGEVIAMEKICRDVLTKGAVQYKTAALEALVHYMGYEAMEYLLTEFREGDLEYRKAILNLAGDIPGRAATRKWIVFLQAVDNTRKAEIIDMLGKRGDLLAAPIIKDALFSASPETRSAAALSLSRLEGRESVPELIDYIRSYETADDQIAGYQALQTVVDTKRRDMIADALEGSGNHTKATMLILISMGGENRFFNSILNYTSSPDPKLRSIAFTELKSVADPVNMEQLINLLTITSEKSEVEHVQEALVIAANEISDEKVKASMIIKGMEDSEQKEKFLPVLAQIGGEEALQSVNQLFVKGNAEMRSLAYKTLSDWSGYEASYVLYEICASGNKNYSDRAFNDYVDKVYKAGIDDAQKIKLLEKILPYALTDTQKKMLEDRINALKESLTSEIKENVSSESQKYILPEEEKADGFVAMFDGISLDNWTGNKEAYIVEDGMIMVKPLEGNGGNLYTEDEYSDFILRFEFQLTPGANNGLGIRAPLTGDAAYVGMELQILDNTAEIYANLQPYQYHGSVYGVIPAKRGFLKPVGEWNEQEVIVEGSSIKVVLNGTVIVDGDISHAVENGTLDKQDHPGLKRGSGHIGFLGHGSVVKFRNIRIKEL
ncbi:MAG: DUF1080 domain-containing protein [Bacteroidales bacterium]|nr:DUF1080 domain-containing protein [Bacteroidales bacterium]